MIRVADYQRHRAAEVIIGVDTYRDQYVAVAIDGRGVRLGQVEVPATIRGYEELELWSCSLGEIRAFGIEGTGSYGAGVARFMTGRCRRCLLCLAFHQLLPQSAAADLLILDQSGTSWVPDHRI